MTHPLKPQIEPLSPEIAAKELGAQHASSSNEMTPRMRTGILWSGGGLLAIAATVLLAAEALIAPGGWSMPAWLWPVPLVLGVAAIGVGFGVMVEESSRQQQADIEATDAFAEIHQDDDAIDRETSQRWE